MKTAIWAASYERANRLLIAASAKNDSDNPIIRWLNEQWANLTHFVTSPSVMDTIKYVAIMAFAVFLIIAVVSGS